MRKADQAAKLVPDALLQRIIDRLAPRQVILFGSRAFGTANRDSDYDLLVVLDDDVPPDHLTLRARHEARLGYDGPVDIVTCRESVLRRRALAVGSFAHTILQEGVVVYDR